MKMSKHICGCGSPVLTISTNPLLDVIKAIADEDALLVLKNLMEKEVRSPFPDGLYGMDPQRTNAAFKNLMRAGIVNSRRDGPDHVYFIHVERLKDLQEFVNGMVNNHAEKA